MFVFAEGCAEDCHGHGECVMESDEWMCVCRKGYDGHYCHIPIETSCTDAADNDNGRSLQFVNFFIFAALQGLQFSRVR